MKDNDKNAEIDKVTLYLSIKISFIIIFVLTVIGVFGSFMRGKLGYILTFIGIFGLAIMVIYTIIIAQQHLAEIRKRNQINQSYEIK